MSDVEFMVGSDPEFFIKDKNTGKHVSAFGIIPGTKRDPFRVDGGAVQVDGMALEFNINPAKTAKEFRNNISTVLEQLREMVPEDYEFDFVPVAQFGKEYIDAQPDAAKELGCDPDYNAYTGEINPKPNADLGFRTASGHVHVGWTDGQDITDPEHIEACKMLTKQLDGYLGLPSLLWDDDVIRSSMYGKMGAFRPKHYGVEYRVLSNAWLTEPALIEYVFNQTVAASKMLLEGSRVYEIINAQRVFQSFDYRNIYSYIHDYIHHPDIQDLTKVKSLYGKASKKTRPAYAQWQGRYNSGDWFYDVSTYEIKHYNDVTMQESRAGLYTCSSTIQYRRKMNDEPFIPLAELNATKSSDLKKRPGKITFDVNTLSTGAGISWTQQIINDYGTNPAAGIVTPPPFPGGIVGQQAEVAILDDFEEDEDYGLEIYDEDDDILEA